MGSYYDNQEAKVKIMHELVKRGWKIFGYKPDQSDGMTDYWSPAHWGGLAEKNGYILCVDIWSMSDSGRKVYSYKKQTATNDKTITNNKRIEKLIALRDDLAASDGEKRNAQAQIDRFMNENQQEKQEFSEVYPEYKHVNPKGSNWHIEKDGQIIAKGKGAFSVNTYDWENEEKSAAEQKAEKLNVFINKIEVALKKSDALESEVIKVPVKVKKEIEKVTKVITESDIKEGFTFKMKVDYTHGTYKGTKYQYIEGQNIRFNFAKLGKRGKPSKSMSNTWCLSIEKINTMLAKGHIAIIEIVEVTEYQERTVFKKTVRKQKVNLDNAVLPGEVHEIGDITECKSKAQTVKEEPATKKQLWALHCATKVDTRELEISKEKASELIGRSKNGESIIDEVKSLLNKNSQTEDVERVAENIIDLSTSTIEEMNIPLFEMDEKQLNKYSTKLIKKINNYNYLITDKVINYLIKEGSYSKLVDILKDSMVREKNDHANQTAEQDFTSHISKIEKQIESAQKKLTSLSGNYLTNTRKRQQEEDAREEKREQLREEIVLLEFLKEKTLDSTITAFEIALLTRSIRDELELFYKRKYEWEWEIEYPVINQKNDLFNKEISKKQKRLAKAGIYNIKQLHEAIDQYKSIRESIHKPRDAKQEQIKKLESKVKFMKLEGYYPTPRNIVDRMLELADIENGHKILEPSAGNGNILDGIKLYLDNNNILVDLEAIERSYNLREILELKGYNLVSDDFLEYGRYNNYDRILMNPPFEKSADIDHVKQAYKCLKNEGRIVAIMSPHFTFANNSKATEFREWLSNVGYYEKLPDQSFKESGTNVNTVIVVIDKIQSCHRSDRYESRLQA